MKTTRLLKVGFGATLCVVLSAGASEFRAVGGRALSMGGAGVARPPTAYTAYYNPAALGVSDTKDALETACGIIVRDTGIADNMNTLMDYDWDAAVDDPEGAEAGAIIAEIRKIKPTDGLMLAPQLAATGIRLGSIGGAIIPAAQLAIFMNLDTAHLNRTDPLDDPGSFAYNSSKLYVRGLGIVEVPLAYGREFKIGDGSSLDVGGGVKFLSGTTFDIRQGVLVTADSEAIQDRLENADKASTGFGIDLGLLFRTMNEKLSVGLLARNVNSPKFKTATDDKFAEDMQLRGGVAYAISDCLYLAADLDLTSNETLIPGYKSRQLGGGICFEPGYVSLRCGLMQDLEGDGAPLVWCMGLGIGGESLHLDITGEFAGNMVDVEDYSIPTEGGLVVSVGGAW